MSNMQKTGHTPFSGKNMDGATLQEYREAKRRADASEAQLDEFCSAIEDFGLDAAQRRMDGRRILCREKAYTPQEILSQAEAEAQRLEKLTGEANDARGRVLTTILHQSKNLAEYRALRWLYVDSAEAGQRAVDVFPEKQGKLS